MKVVTWNCNGALRVKHPAIDLVGADLLVIQECEDPSRSTLAYRHWAGNYLWTGTNKNKGLGVFLRMDLELKQLDWNSNELQFFLPCSVGDEFNLVAVWTKQANSPNFRYIGQLWKYLQLYKERLASERTLFSGDLNSNKCWDEWDRWWNHTDVVRELAEIGCKSIYHDHFSEEQGEESRATLYHQRNPLKRYHVDYAFSNMDHVRGSVDVGAMEYWLKYSDHMPLSFNLRHRD